MATDSSGVAAVVVTYRPDPAPLGALLDALAPQVEALVLVDNGSGADLAAWLAAHAPANLVPLLLAENRGLAAAQNLGIAEARRRGLEFVLLSDQDSLPAPDMVAQLLTVARREMAAGRRLAALGPRYRDAAHDDARPFVRLGGFRMRRFDCTRPGQTFEVDHLIASGSLIPLAVLADVGAMNEALFIDYIDTEWGLRAWRKGYVLLGVCDALMRHRLGDRPRRFLGRHVPVHSPLRHYYLFRNAVWLARQRWLPAAWKLATLWRLMLVLGYFLPFGPQRGERLLMIGRGLRDGLAARMGPYRG